MTDLEIEKDLSLLKTGEDIEKEFNRIIFLAREYKISHVKAGQILNRLFDYGEKTGKFSKEEVQHYINRKNSHKNGQSRTHLQFALNLSRGQSEENKVFLYFIEWLKKNKKEKIEWELNGSDLDGYIMIVSKNRRKVIEADYKVRIGKSRGLVEAKSFQSSFKSSSWFKVINLKQYKKEGALLIVKYNSGYYLFKRPSIVHILENGVRREGYSQEVIEINQKYIDELVDKKLVKEIRNEN